MEQKGYECISGKLKTTFSIVYGILLWAIRLSSIIKVSQFYIGAIIYIPQLKKKEDCDKYHHQLYDKLPSSTLLPSCFSSSSSLSVSLAGDVIGSESGIYMSSSKDTLLDREQRRHNSNSTLNSSYQKKKILTKENGKKTGFPPPLTSLVSTKKNLAYRGPWVFDKYYVDGRLIVKEKRVNRLEYLETYRENGRLVMNLVRPFDDTSESCQLDRESVNLAS